MPHPRVHFNRLFKLQCRMWHCSSSGFEYITPGLLTAVEPPATSSHVDYSEFRVVFTCLLQLPNSSTSLRLNLCALKVNWWCGVTDPQSPLQRPEVVESCYESRRHCNSLNVTLWTWGRWAVKSRLCSIKHSVVSLGSASPYCHIDLELKRILTPWEERKPGS